MVNVPGETLQQAQEDRQHWLEQAAHYEQRMTSLQEALSDIIDKCQGHEGCDRDAGHNVLRQVLRMAREALGREKVNV